MEAKLCPIQKNLCPFTYVTGIVLIGFLESLQTFQGNIVEGNMSKNISKNKIL